MLIKKHVEPRLKINLDHLKRERRKKLMQTELEAYRAIVIEMSNIEGQVYNEVQEYVCNEVADCSDLTDEQGCKCEHNEFTCRNQECIPTHYKCNGFADCADSSDEDVETCKGNVAL